MMQNDWVINDDEANLSIKDTDFMKYEEKLIEYGLVFEQILEEFNFDIFGEYENSVSVEEWNTKLAACGWKYFDRKNLNELFFTKMEILHKANLFDKMPAGYRPDTD